VKGFSLFLLIFSSANPIFSKFVTIGVYISTSRRDRNKISTVTPSHFRWQPFQWNYPMWPEVENSRWRALNFQNVSLYLCLISTKFQRYTNVFGVQIRIMHGNVVRPNGKKPIVENPRWRPLNFQNVYLSLYTRYQRNSNGYTYVFGVQLSYNDNGNVVRSNGKKSKVKIQDGGLLSLITRITYILV